MMSATKVVHVSRQKYDVYIGRGPDPKTGVEGKWGNLFRLDGMGRMECVKRHADWLLGCPQLLTSIHEIKGKTLGCWCRPLFCHGDTLARLADMSETVDCGISEETFNEVSTIGSGYDDSWMEASCWACGWYESTCDWYESCPECGSHHVANTGSWFCDVKSKPRVVSVFPGVGGVVGIDYINRQMKKRSEFGLSIDEETAWLASHADWKKGIMSKLFDHIVPCENVEETGIFG